MTRADRDQFESDVAERLGAERAGVTLGALVTASLGSEVRLTLVDGSLITGGVVDAAPQWIVIAAGARTRLVPVTAIAQLQGLGAGAPHPREVERRLSLGHALRAIMRDRAEVIVRASGHAVSGRIASVGADFFTLEAAGDAGPRVLPFAAVLSVDALV